MRSSIKADITRHLTTNGSLEPVIFVTLINSDDPRDKILVDLFSGIGNEGTFNVVSNSMSDDGSGSTYYVYASRLDAEYYSFVNKPDSMPVSFNQKWDRVVDALSEQEKIIDSLLGDMSPLATEKREQAHLDYQKLSQCLSIMSWTNDTHKEFERYLSSLEK